MKTRTILNSRKAYQKEVWNPEGTKGVLIFRSKLSDGYNYYLVKVNKSEDRPWNGTFIDGNYIQKQEILSEKEAIKTANQILI